MAENDDILFEVRGRLGLVTLNRPQALNAFTLDMYRRLDPVLRAWENDPAIEAVAIQGAGDRAFCAGGDIRAIYEAGKGIGPDPGLTRDFFREEYRLMRRVHRYAKPYIALIDGITMGGGAGMALNGRYRIATERTGVPAMPEYRDRDVSRCRGDAVFERVSRTGRALSWADGGTARRGGYALLRAGDAFRAVCERLPDVPVEGPGRNLCRGG